MISLLAFHKSNISHVIYILFWFVAPGDKVGDYVAMVLQG